MKSFVIGGFVFVNIEKEDPIVEQILKYADIDMEASIDERLTGLYDILPPNYVISMWVFKPLQAWEQSEVRIGIQRLDFQITGLMKVG